ncbi:MAG: hypothetical protein WCI18_05455 [Pseudomonadota bacterium]
MRLFLPRVEKKLFKPKTLGLKEQNSSKSRQHNPDDSTFSVEFMFPIVVGAGVRAGQFVKSDKRWVLNLELAASGGELLGCVSNLTSRGIAAT